MTVLLLKVLTPVRKAACDFCGMKREVIRSEISSRAICYHCVHNAKEVLGKIPPASVACLRCGKYDNLVVTYEQATVHYVSRALDINGVCIYTIDNARGTVSRSMKKKGARCGHCKTHIPLYLFSRNYYII